jgi:hypothetical protein
MKSAIQGLAVMIGAAMFWSLGGAERSAPVLGASSAGPVSSLEAIVAAHPESTEMTQRLAQAYLDARQPGLARALLDAAPTAVRGDARTRHLLARTLVEEGRNDSALEVEASVLAQCRSEPARELTASCDSVLWAAATRRAGILRQMVAFGVHDVVAQPEASLVAYRSATRQARIALQ